MLCKYFLETCNSPRTYTDFYSYATSSYSATIEFYQMALFLGSQQQWSWNEETKRVMGRWSHVSRRSVSSLLQCCRCRPVVQLPQRRWRRVYGGEAAVNSHSHWWPFCWVPRCGYWQHHQAARRWRGGWREGTSREGCRYRRSLALSSSMMWRRPWASSSYLSSSHVEA